MTPLLILYSRRDAFGDGLCRIPALRAARTAFPDSQIVYGCEEGTQLAKALRHYTASLIDEIRTRISLPNLMREFEAAKRPTQIIDFRMTPPQLLMTSLSLIGSGIRYEANVAGFVLSRRSRQRYQARPEHNAWRYHRLVERLAGRHLPFDHRLDVPETARAAARQLRGADTRPLVLLCGAGKADKPMATGQAAQIATSLFDAGFQVIYLETPGAGPDVAALVKQEPRLSIVGSALGLSMADLDDLFLALGEMAKAYVGIEGGMAHLQATVMTPTVVINHGANVERWRPLSNFVEVVEARGASKSGRIADVPPALVMEAVHRLVAAVDRDHASR